MTRAEALQKLRRVLGAKAYYYVGKAISSQESRDEAAAMLTQARIDRERISKECDTLRKRLLDDPEYRSLVAAHNAAKKECERLGGEAHYYRFTVGTSEDVAGLRFGHQRAQGDTWEQVFAQLEERKAQAS